MMVRNIYFKCDNIMKNGEFQHETKISISLSILEIFMLLQVFGVLKKFFGLALLIKYNRPPQISFVRTYDRREKDNKKKL